MAHTDLDPDRESDEELEEQEDEEEVEAADPEPTPPKGRRGRPRKQVLGAADVAPSPSPLPATPRIPAKAFRLREEPEATSWRNAEAENLLPEILACLGQAGHAWETKSAADIEARITQVEPGPRTPVGLIDGYSFVEDGTHNPGDKLIQLVDDGVHLPSGLGTTKYQVTFVWKAGPRGGTIIGQGLLVRPAAAQIHAQRQAGASTPRGPRVEPVRIGYGQAAPPPLGYPPPVSPSAAGAPYAPPAPFVQVPPPADPMTGRLLDTLVHQLNETRAELAALRGQPPPPPVTMPAAPASMSEESIVEKLYAKLHKAPSEDSIVDKIAARLHASGFGAAPAPPPAPINPAAEKLNNFFSMALEKVMEQTAKNFLGGIQKVAADAIGGATNAPGAPAAAAPATEAIAEVVDAAADVLRFHQVELKGRWKSGRPVIMTPSKDGTGFMGQDLSGFMMNNIADIAEIGQPLIQAVSAGAERIMGAVGSAAERMTGAPSRSQVVNHTPPGAVDATPHEPHVHTHTHEEPPQPNGQGGAGWSQS